jgi:hypothetical protein
MKQKFTPRRISMRKLFLVLMMITILVTIALAAVTWHSGPTFEVTAAGPSTFTWHAAGDGSGFGNKPAQATITFGGTVRYTCQNKGGNQSPGQNPVPAIGSASADLGNADHNGRGVFDFSVTFAAAPSVSGKVAGCPNGNWQGVSPVVEGTPSAILSITQGNSTIFGPSAACPASAIGPCPGF